METVPVFIFNPHKLFAKRILTPYELFAKRILTPQEQFTTENLCLFHLFVV